MQKRTAKLSTPNHYAQSQLVDALNRHSYFSIIQKQENHCIRRFQPGHNTVYRTMLWIKIWWGTICRQVLRASRNLRTTHLCSITDCIHQSWKQIQKMFSSHHTKFRFSNIHTPILPWKRNTPTRRKRHHDTWPNNRPINSKSSSKNISIMAIQQ